NRSFCSRTALEAASVGLFRNFTQVPQFSSAWEVTRSNEGDGAGVGSAQGGGWDVNSGGSQNNPGCGSGSDPARAVRGWLTGFSGTGSGWGGVGFDSSWARLTSVARRRAGSAGVGSAGRASGTRRLARNRTGPTTTSRKAPQAASRSQRPDDCAGANREAGEQRAAGFAFGRGCVGVPLRRRDGWVPIDMIAHLLMGLLPRQP